MLRRNDSRRTKPLPLVVINMTHEETIRAIAETYGANSVYERLPGKPHHALAFRAEWRGSRAIAFLREIREYMITKRRHADLLIEFAESFDARTKRGGMGPGKRFWTDDEVEEMDVYVDNVRQLNARGVA